MKNLCTILFVSLLTLSLTAQEAKPVIEFKQEVIDYGIIEKGSDGVRQFEFTNTGTAPLIISRVYSSCGCTIPKKPEDPIAPGESGVIEVKYDTKRVGPIRKTISVYTNAGEIPQPLKIKGEIKEKSKGAAKSAVPEAVTKEVKKAEKAKTPASE